MKQFLTTLAIACVTGGIANAQFYVPEGQPIPNVTSVTNEGVAVGYNDQNCPFYIWDAVNNTQKLIGGLSAGAGVGGNPHFTEDGKFIAAPMQSDKIKVYTEWNANTFEQLAPYRFTQVLNYYDTSLFAVATTPDGKGGTIFRSANNGVSWKSACEYSFQKEDGSYGNIIGLQDFPIYCIALIDYRLIAGCGNGKLLLSRGNVSWQETELTGFTLDKAISAYRAMSFTYVYDQYENASADKGCILLELEDGSFAVVYTLDGTDTFSVSEGFAARPKTLANNGKDFFLGTSDGLIQRSQDGGATWTTVCTDDAGRAFNRIVFADENKGVALTDNVIYITRDGGATWTITYVFPSTGIGDSYSSTWQDAAWLDDFFMIVGTNGCCYSSDDDGATFKKVDGFNGDLGAIFYDSRRECTILGEAGKVWRKEHKEYASGYTAGMYDVEKDTWTPLVSTGFSHDSSFSSPWNISGDGKHTVGIAPGLNTVSGSVVSYASIWDGTDKVTTLDNYFEDKGRACRANAVSYDGSVVVGWQDIWGPWFGSVWRRQADGSYKQTLLSVDTDLNPEDFKYDTSDEKYAVACKLVGACQAVSADGKWIGGRAYDGMGLDGAWIWNEEDGFTVVYPDMDSTVADMNADASVVVGWVGPGSSAWIWTKEDGRMQLQDYIENKLGYSLNNFGIASVYDMSPNGRYICGYGMQGGSPVAYVFDMFHTSGIEEMEAAQVKASIYPNPASEELHVDLPFSYTELPTTLTLVSMQGQVVKQVKNPAASNVMDIRNLSAGLYLLDVNANGSHKTYKVIIK